MGEILRKKQEYYAMLRILPYENIRESTKKQGCVLVKFKDYIYNTDIRTTKSSSGTASAGKEKKIDYENDTQGTVHQNIKV